MLREGGREGCRERERVEVRGERERRLVVRWKCLFSHFKVPSSVCVFKINRPCDEQPVPCWKYILWNTTVLCRKPAKHWLGSIELQLYCSVKQWEKYTFAPLFKRCHFYLRASTSTRIEAFSSLWRDGAGTRRITCTARRGAPPHHDWVPTLAVRNCSCTVKSTVPT